MALWPIRENFLSKKQKNTLYFTLYLFIKLLTLYYLWISSPYIMVLMLLETIFCTARNIVNTIILFRLKQLSHLMILMKYQNMTLKKTCVICFYKIPKFP